MSSVRVTTADKVDEEIFTQNVESRSLWKDAIHRIKKDRFAVICFWTIVFYALIAVLVKSGLLVADWQAEVGQSYSPPSFDSFWKLFGTDIFGRSVMSKVIYGAYVAMSVGLVSTLIAVPIGVFFGAVGGYFGGLIDEFVVWFYTTVSSIPSIILLSAIAFVMGKGLLTLYIAIGLTSWVSMARVVRGEFIKHKSREYVIAASGLGASHLSKIFKHILPNVFHQVIIVGTIIFQSAIRYEVILSYLGLGVQGQPSWGIMIDDAKLELSRGVWWQLTGATFAMFALLLAFNIFGDTLRDSLDPKLKQ